MEVARKKVPTGTVLHWGGDIPAPRNAREVVVFLSFLVVGLAPPFSPFMVAVLEEFTLHLMHLTPNTVLTLALFSHTYEMFMGVQSSVEIFRHFFAPCWSSSLSPGPGAVRQLRTIGGVFFRRRGAGILPTGRRDKWENWERHWLYLEVDNPSPFLRLPLGPPVGNS